MAHLFPGKRINNASEANESLVYAREHCSQCGKKFISQKLFQIHGCFKKQELPLQLGGTHKSKSKKDKKKKKTSKHRLAYSNDFKYALLRKFFVHFHPVGICTERFAAMERIDRDEFNDWVKHHRLILARFRNK